MGSSARAAVSGNWTLMAVAGTVLTATLMGSIARTPRNGTSCRTILPRVMLQYLPGRLYTLLSSKVRISQRMA